MGSFRREKIALAGGERVSRSVFFIVGVSRRVLLMFGVAGMFRLDNASRNGNGDFAGRFTME